MSFIRRIIVTLRRPRTRYADEVLFAGWVQLPAALRKRGYRRS